MNKTSLAYNINKKQQGSSWIDEIKPKMALKGVATMSHGENVYSYAEELVANFATYDKNDDRYYLNLFSIPEYAQDELSRLYIEHNDREINECVYGDDFTINNNYTCALLAMLQDNCQETRDNFADVVRKNILIYFEESLQLLLNEACENYLHKMNNEQGLYAYQDMENGDTLWRGY